MQNLVINYDSLELSYILIQLLYNVDNQTGETFSVVLERQSFGDLVKFMKGFYEEINRINGFDSQDSSVHYGL